jgi:F420-dependent oxidoreductase-like protein
MARGASVPRFAIKTAQHHAEWSDVLAVWKEADQIALFESAWNFDHFYPIVEDPGGPCMEAWTMLSALAQATSRIRIGTMVNGMHHRHPAVTANMAASLDIISNGRLDLGLGTGWFELESQAYGLELGSVKDRLDRFDEGVEVILNLLSQDTTTHSGRYYSLTDARCEPKGPQRPHPPIAIGGRGEKRMLRSVARWAQIWDAVRTGPDEWPRKHEVLVQHCETAGRDPREITCSAHVAVMPEDDLGEVVERAALYFEAGVDLVVVSLRAPFDVSIVTPLAERLSEIT